MKSISVCVLKYASKGIQPNVSLPWLLITHTCNTGLLFIVIEAHEELKEAAVKCMGDLFKKCSIRIVELFYCRQSAALLSHGIWLGVKLAKQEKSTSLRYVHAIIEKFAVATKIN